MVRTARQAESGADFGDWTSLPPLTDVVDLDAIDTGELDLYALDAAGDVWTMNADEPGSAWKMAATSRGGIVAIAARANGDAAQLFGVDVHGNVRELVDDHWQILAAP